MKIYKITEASEYLGVSINTLKTLANNGKIKCKTCGEECDFIEWDDLYMGKDGSSCCLGSVVYVSKEIKNENETV